MNHVKIAREEHTVRRPEACRVRTVQLEKQHSTVNLLAAKSPALPENIRKKELRLVQAALPENTVPQLALEHAAFVMQDIFRGQEPLRVLRARPENIPTARLPPV